MKILHVVGNKMEQSNGIGRLIPEMIEMQNRNSKKIEASLLVINDEYANNNFKSYLIKNITDIKGFLKEYDLIIFHGIYYFKYLEIAKKVKELGKKYLVKPHSSLMIEAQKKSYIKKKIFNLIFFNKFLKKANGIIYTNNDELNNSLKLNEENYIEPNGIEFEEKELEFDKMINPKVRFIYLSRIDFKHKGTDLLIEALKIIKKEKKISEINLEIFGKGNLREEEYLKNAIKELNVSNIVFRGSIFGEEKIEKLKEKDIFILTSRYEGFPMAILEALYFGNSCIVTPGANMTEIINKYELGWLVETTPSSIAQMILEVNKIPIEEREKKSKAAKKYVREHHCWKNIVKISEKIYGI